MESGSRTASQALAEKELRKKFSTACKRNDLSLAIGLLYQWLDRYGGAEFDGSIRNQFWFVNQPHSAEIFDRLMHGMYSSENREEVDLRSFSRLFINEIMKRKGKSEPDWLGIELKLN